MEVFAEIEGTLVQVTSVPSTMCPALVIRFYDKEGLQRFWKSIKKSDTLTGKLATILITDTLSKRNYKNWEMTVDCDEKEYKRGLKRFAKGMLYGQRYVIWWVLNF